MQDNLEMKECTFKPAIIPLPEYYKPVSGLMKARRGSKVKT